jgi:hypothetical protein
VCRVQTIGGSGTRQYAVQDANFNVTSLTSASGTVNERYSYSPYGQRTILDAK